MNSIEQVPYNRLSGLDEDMDQVVFGSAYNNNQSSVIKSTEIIKYSIRTPDLEPRNLSNGFEQIPPSTWTNEYTSFIEQINRMKSEMMQLGEENDDMINMIVKDQED